MVLGSIRREYLDFFVILDERHLCRLMKQYQAYFNQARPQQEISQRIPCLSEHCYQRTGTIIVHTMLGGLFTTGAGEQPVQVPSSRAV
jgi:hypothetical protein